MSVSLNGILLVAGAAIFQLVAVCAMPASRGMTVPGPTAITIVCYVIGLYLMSRLFVSGMGLTLVLPMMTLLIISGAIIVGILFYNETASALKIAMLAGAAGLLVGSSYV